MREFKKRVLEYQTDEEFKQMLMSAGVDEEDETIPFHKFIQMVKPN